MNEHIKESGAKDWSGNKRSIYTTLGASNYSDKEREQHGYWEFES